MEDRLLGMWDYLKSIPLFAKVVTGGIVTGVLAVVILRRKRSSKKEYPKNTVIIYQLGRGPHVPSISPFCMKLETYLRMAKIPYQNDHDFKKGPKGKFPWIEYNGEVVADSSFSIKLSTKHLVYIFTKDFREKKKRVPTRDRQYWRNIHFGDKKFIAGDNPCEEDAAIFGLLAQFYWESLRPN